MSSLILAAKMAAAAIRQADANLWLVKSSNILTLALME
jgi:hypothetical protein